MAKDALRAFVDDGLDLPHRHVKLFRERLIADAIYHPSLEYGAIALGKYPAVDKQAQIIGAYVLGQFHFLVLVPFEPPFFLRTFFRIIRVCPRVVDMVFISYHIYALTVLLIAVLG